MHIRVHFKEDIIEDIIQTFYDGIKHKPETTFGNVKADVRADKDPHFTRGDFCSVIRGSAWRVSPCDRSTQAAIGRTVRLDIGAPQL
jgi:hypothetical protein